MAPAPLLWNYPEIRQSNTRTASKWRLVMVTPFLRRRFRDFGVLETLEILGLGGLDEAEYGQRKA